MNSEQQIINALVRGEKQVSSPFEKRPIIERWEEKAVDIFQCIDTGALLNRTEFEKYQKSAEWAGIHFIVKEIQRY